MPELRKPVVASDLPLPFAAIGELGWARRAREILDSYEVPLPTPVPDGEVSAAEVRLGARLPVAYRELLTTLGPLDFDGIRLLPIDEVDWLADFWAKPAFDPCEATRLATVVGIADYAGSGDLIALDPATGECALCGHDPPGFSCALPSIDALVQYGFVSLASSYYGWPDREILDLVDAALRERFGFVF